MNQETVFNFVSIRPPQFPSDETIENSFVRLNESPTPLIRKLMQVKAYSEKKKLAKTFIDSDDYIYNSANYKKIFTISSEIKDFSATVINEISYQQIVKTIQNILGTSVNDFLNKPFFKKTKINTWDSYFTKIILFKHIPNEREKILTIIRTLNLLELINDNTVKERQKILLFKALNKIRVILPKAVFTDEKKKTDVNPKPPKNNNEEKEKKITTLRQEIKDLEETLPELKALFNKKLIAAPKQLPRKEKVEKAKASVVKAEEYGSTEDAWNFDEKELTKGIQNLLLKNDLIWIGIDSPSLIHKTEKVIADKKVELQTLHLPDLAPKTLFNNIIVEASPEYYETVKGVYAHHHENEESDSVLSGARPLGIGDLLVVKQRLLRYEAGEVAHIENVMKSEHKERKHRRLNRQEEILYVETENQKESERDLQSTERFEMQKETSSTIESDTKFAAGVKVNYYGFVNVEAHADYASENSTSESNKNSTNYAKDVTERSVSKILERTKEERTRKTFEEIEEINTHGFDNHDGEHINGIYRWVDKMFEAQVYNYGRRLMYEFIVPEPAVFYLNSLIFKQNVKLGTIKQPPPPPTITPSGISRTNYLRLLARYEVKDGAAPPPHGMVFSEMIDIPNNKDRALVTKIKDSAIPEGYKAISIKAYIKKGGQIHHTNPPDPDYSKYSQVYVSTVRYGSGFLDLGGIVGKLPSGFLTDAQAFLFSFSVYCELIPEVFEKWQIDTYSKIINGYKKLVMDYESKISSAQIQQGVQISGDNPLNNRTIEKTELKKQCLSILMKDRFENAGSVNNDMGEFRFKEAAREGKVSQFFEQAFEWNNVTYTFYPYFWGRKNEWMNKMALDVPDPIFNHFLKAGAVRVIVPVHPAYSEAILYFQQTEDLPLEERIWNGGEPPTLEDPLFISISEEIKAASDLTENALPVGNAWQIKLPTTLVWLQEESGLPNYETEG